MLPAGLFTVRMPLATVQFAAAEWSLSWSWAETHSSRFLPSNRMMASEGAAPQVAPGVTTLGSGCQTSVSSGLGAGLDSGCWARGVAARVRNRSRVVVRVRMGGEGYTRGRGMRREGERSRSPFARKTGERFRLSTVSSGKEPFPQLSVKLLLVDSLKHRFDHLLRNQGQIFGGASGGCSRVRQQA